MHIKASNRTACLDYKRIDLVNYHCNVASNSWLYNKELEPVKCIKQYSMHCYVVLGNPLNINAILLLSSLWDTAQRINTESLACPKVFSRTQINPSKEIGH